jgi:oxaloacetate decarboxylase alpha subunit
VPKLVDTTIRLLGQDPLAGTMGTAELLRLAEILDRAGFAYLEVSGGGVFDSAVRRGVESPWERIRAIQARVKTPLGLALRGRFLVGSRPVDGEFARRFVASAAENGIDVFRLHDPLNDVSNLREAAEAIAAADREFEAGLVYSPGVAGEVDTLVEQARKLPELGAARVVVHDPTGSLGPHGAAELVQRVGEASGLPVGVYCQGAGGNAMSAALEAMRVGADLAACAIYPVALAVHRVAGESLAEALKGLGLDTGVDVDALWEASEIVDQHIGDEPVTPLAPRVAVRAAEYRLPAGLVAGIDASLRAQAAGDRLDEVLEELSRIRGEVGSPPLAAPIGQILGSQALVHVLSAQRYLMVVDELRELVSGAYGTPPGEVDPGVRRALELVAEDDVSEPVTLEDVREQTQGLASSEEELLLVGLFGDDAEALLQGIRARAGGDDAAARGVDRSRAERIREIVRVVQESGVGEVTIEESGMRVSVRRTPDQAFAPVPVTTTGGDSLEPAVLPTVANGFVRVEAPMVGTFYRASQPGAPVFVEEGDAVSTGQTLCILEAMKLMNEIKAETEGIVRKIHVQNAQPVEFGQLLFELEPLPGRPLV